jgi:predicted Zn-dependent protease
VRKQLGETGKAKELRQAFQWAQEVADAHPDAVAAQRLAGEAAYRVSRWSDAAAYLQRGEGLPDSEPELLFYLAVSLYESGDAPGAAAALRRALPNLQRSPYVDAYARKILAR